MADYILPIPIDPDDHTTGFDPYPDETPADEGTATSTTTSTTTSTASAYTFYNYQDDTATTAIYPGAGTESPDAITYTILGLVGEAGEIANKWKKFYRDLPVGGANICNEFFEGKKRELTAELQDVLWYTSQLATELGVSLGDVAADNIRKLNDRKRRNVLGGSGDNR